MKGQVFTPSYIVDRMVNKLFEYREPKTEDLILDPGCGDGAFINGILRWCSKKNVECPKIIGIESDPKLADKCKKKFASYQNITILQQNFLMCKNLGIYNFIIGNPPYVRIEELNEEERKTYRKNFETAVGRFDLYILFFEQALKHLSPDGCLVFITPEKFLYTWTAEPLRRLMAKYHVKEIEFIDERVFKGLTTYPVITTITRGEGLTRIILRDGTSLELKIPSDGSPWLPAIHGKEHKKSRYTLGDACDRISCGVATGADEIFIIPLNKIHDAIKPFVKLTISGKQLGKFPPGTILDEKKLTHAILTPYDNNGKLLPENKLKEFIKWLLPYKDRLKERYCVKNGKKWYAFHEDPPMSDLLKPKILFKDIAKEPAFWVDAKGVIIPRHNVYYLIPKNSKIIPYLLEYLNGEEVKEWLRANCQRAANNYLRLQSRIVKKLPLPDSILQKIEG